MISWGQEFNNLNRNKNVRLSEGVDVALEAPVEADSMQGLKLNQFCNIANRLNPKRKSSFNNWLGNIDPVDSLYLSLSTPLNMVNRIMSEFNFNNLDEAMIAIKDDPIIKNEFYKKINSILYCGNAVHELKVMYDGTLINC
jgi:hypothetical protein